MRSTVAVLLGARRPSAIAWAVALAVVVAFDAVLCAGSRPHVVEKVGEHVPALANRDAPFSVVSVRLVAGVGAALAHRVPGVAFRRDASAAGVPMHQAGGVSSFSPETSARLVVAVAKVAGGDIRRGAAITQAPPDEAPKALPRSGAFDGDETAEALAAEIESIRHSAYLTTFSTSTRSRSGTPALCRHSSRSPRGRTVRLRGDRSTS